MKRREEATGGREWKCRERGEGRGWSGHTTPRRAHRIPRVLLPVCCFDFAAAGRFLPAAAGLDSSVWCIERERERENFAEERISESGEIERGGQEEGGRVWALVRLSIVGKHIRRASTKFLGFLCRALQPLVLDTLLLSLILCILTFYASDVGNEAVGREEGEGTRRTGN